MPSNPSMWSDPTCLSFARRSQSVVDYTKAGQGTTKLNAASEPLGEVVACSSVVVTVWRLSSSLCWSISQVSRLNKARDRGERAASSSSRQSNLWNGIEKKIPKRRDSLSRFVSRRCPTLAVPVPGRWTIHDSRVSITAVPSERWHVGPIGPSKPPTRALAFAHQSVTFPCACI
jgi:hypothetical protein